MVNNKVVYFLIAIIFSCIVYQLNADEITLKNGKILYGNIYDQREDSVCIEIDFDGVKVPSSIKKSDIVSIEFDNESLTDEATLFAIQQQTKGLELYKGRWLPKKHVDLLRQRQQKIKSVRKLAVFSIQFFIFFIIGFAIVIGLDFLNYQLRKYKLHRVINKENADNRLHRRIYLKFPIKFTTQEGISYDACTSNISLGGLLFHTEVNLNLADQLSIQVISSDSVLNVTGLVVRKIKGISGTVHNIGVSFIGLDKSKRQQIAQLIANKDIEKMLEKEEKDSDQPDSDQKSSNEPSKVLKKRRKGSKKKKSKNAV